MSSTNRGAKRKENDFYATPGRAFMSILPYLPKTLNCSDPAAGDGRLIKWMMESGRIAWGCDLTHGFTCVDDVITIDPDSGVDFLKDDQFREVVVTNPPFSLAQEFIHHSLQVADETFMLLRLNFLGAQKRAEWWKSHEPDAIFVLSERPDFTGGGGDSCEYAWFYFGSRYQGIRHI